MCRRQILSSVWRSGHREQCAVKNKRILEAMPVPESCKVGSSNHPPSKSSQMYKKYFRCNVQKKYSQMSQKYFRCDVQKNIHRRPKNIPRCDVQNADRDSECGRRTTDHLSPAAAQHVLSWGDSGPPGPTGLKLEKQQKISCFSGSPASCATLTCVRAA